MIHANVKPGLQIDALKGGVPLIRFRDSFGRPCSLQEAKLGLLPAIWLGLNEMRMHLDQKGVRQILPLLQHFVETGQLQHLASSMQATQETSLPSPDGGGISLADVEFMVRGHEAEALHQLLLLLHQARQDADRQRQFLARCRILLEKPSQQIANCEYDDFWQGCQNECDALLKEMAEYDER